MNEETFKNSEKRCKEQGEKFPQIYVSARAYKVPGPTVSYEQIVEIWNELHKPEGKYLLDQPGIDYENGPCGERGVLWAGQSVPAVDGTSFSVDPEHVS